MARYGWRSNYSMLVLLRHEKEMEYQSLYLTAVGRALLMRLGVDGFPSFQALSLYSQNVIDTRTGEEIVEDLIAEIER